MKRVALISPKPWYAWVWLFLTWPLSIPTLLLWNRPEYAPPRRLDCRIDTDGLFLKGINVHFYIAWASLTEVSARRVHNGHFWLHELHLTGTGSGCTVPRGTAEGDEVFRAVVAALGFDPQPLLAHEANPDREAEWELVCWRKTAPATAG